MRMQPSAVMMYVPVELAPPNVQKSVTVVAPLVVREASNMAPPYAPTLVVGSVR